MKCLKVLGLRDCILVENFPEELGCLQCLKLLCIVGTGIIHLPHSIFRLKGLCIEWSRGKLESYGFTSITNVSRYSAFCII
ncbi:putative leucine-rich repeat domain superfamily [Helianthus annuus]|nr:putative leucine-rich repeat domain superfamily [Helianthus annuus]